MKALELYDPDEMESSANVNTNPRIEQTAIHASQALFEFYLEFFDGLRSIARGG